MKKDIRPTKRMWAVGGLIAIVWLLCITFGLVDTVIPTLQVNRQESVLPGIYIWFAILTALLAAGIFFCYRKQLPVQKIFVMTAIPMGLLYVFFVPLQCGSDEYDHFSVAYYNSSRILGEDTLDEEGYTLVRGEDTRKRYGFSKYPTRETFESQYQNLFQNEIDNSQKRLAYCKDILAYGYAPHILGITLGRIMGCNGVQLQLLARIFGLLCFVVIVYYAIKKMPFGKMLMLLVACAPMSIHQAAVITYDMLIHALCFLYIAHMLQLAYEHREVMAKDWILPVLVMALVVPLKIVYIILAGMVFLIPRKKCQGKWNYYAGVVLVCAAGLIATVLTQRTATSQVLTQSVATVPWGDEPAYTLGYALENPGKTIRLLLRTLVRNGDMYVGTAIGRLLCWFTSDVVIPFAYIFAYILLLVLASMTAQGEKQPFTWKSRSWLLFLSAGVSGAVILSMLLGYTSIYGEVVKGVQGRYFIPILPLVFLVLRNDKIVWKRDYTMVFVGTMAVLHVLILLSMFHTIVMR